jgi:hypothetical protein
MALQTAPGRDAPNLFLTLAYIAQVEFVPFDWNLHRSRQSCTERIANPPNFAIHLRLFQTKLALNSSSDPARCRKDLVDNENVEQSGAAPDDEEREDRDRVRLGGETNITRGDDFMEAVVSLQNKSRVIFCFGFWNQYHRQVCSAADSHTSRLVVAQSGGRTVIRQRTNMHGVNERISALQEYV